MSLVRGLVEQLGIAMNVGKPSAVPTSLPKLPAQHLINMSAPAERASWMAQFSSSFVCQRSRDRSNKGKMERIMPTWPWRGSEGEGGMQSEGGQDLASIKDIQLSTHKVIIHGA